MFVQQAVTKGCYNKNMLVFYVKQRTLSPFLPFLKNFVSKYQLTLLLPHGAKLVCKRCSLDKVKTGSFVAMESTLLTTYCCQPRGIKNQFLFRISLSVHKCLSDRMVRLMKLIQVKLQIYAKVQGKIAFQFLRRFLCTVTFRSWVRMW